MINQNPSHRFIYSLLFILVFSGCAQHQPARDTLQDKKAALLADQAKSFNQHLFSSKGTGWARVETRTKTEKFKIAWAAVFPNKIRITFLISGSPVETIIATGEKITFFSHTGEHAKYTYRSKDPDMEEYIKVPIKMSEMILVLLGRLPVKNFDHAYFSKPDVSLSTISLQKKRTGVTQTLQFNDTGEIERLTSADGSGKFVYEMKITRYKAYDFGQIPSTIEINDMDNRKLILDITGFQANPAIKEAVFRLTESG